MLNSVETISDAALVADSLAGNREAFGQIVARYQTLICSLAYSRTGSLSHSEDLAQETFIAAWKQLASLREPHKLRSWLCGIARNHICDALKKQGREPSHAAEPLDTAQESPSPGLPPHELAISKEEEAILWRAIERMPETYREPLILYYREHQTIKSVAEALELSEEATRQRLVRGRKVLQEEVLAFVEGALARTNPGRAFTLGVLAALPLTLGATVKAATLAAATGGAATKATLFGVAFGWLIGPVLGIWSMIEGLRGGLKGARTPRERACVVGQFKMGLLMALIFGGCIVAFMFVPLAFLKNHTLLVFLLGLAVMLGFLAAIWFGSRRVARAFTGFRAEEERLHPELAPSSRHPGPRSATWEYRSRAALFGLPLVHCCISNPLKGQKVKPAIGWIAVGQVAYGIIFASGGRAVGGICLGGFSIGLVSIGGFCLGFLAWGGLAVGAVALGGLAVGLLASGGVAIAWHAAFGCLAAAHDLACGDAALANHVNDAVVQSFFHRYRWLDINQPGPDALFWLLVFGPPLLQTYALKWWVRKQAKRGNLPL